MNTSEIETLHDEALEFYVEGRYAEARHAWETILSSVPGDPRALEGVRMVLVLAGEWGLGESSSGPARPDSGGGSGSMLEAVSKIETLLRGGRYQEAVAAGRVLSEAHPENVEVRSLTQRARQHFESDLFISGEVDRAMIALQLGDADEARQACRQVLGIEPEHRQAHALMGLADQVMAQPARPEPRPARIGRDEPLAANASHAATSVTSKVAAGSAAPSSSMEARKAIPAPAAAVAAKQPGETMMESQRSTAAASEAMADNPAKAAPIASTNPPAARPASALVESRTMAPVTAEAEAAAAHPAAAAPLESRAIAPDPDPTGAFVRSPESAPGTLFEMPDEPVSAIPMAAEGEQAAAPASSHGDIPADESFFDLSEELLSLEAEEAGAFVPTSVPGGEDRAQVAAASNPSAAASSAKRMASAFSELDAEIDQTLAHPAAEGDLEFQASTEPASDSPAAASPGDLDFCAEFGGFSEGDPVDDGSKWADLNAAVGAEETSREARVATLIDEARRFLDSARYSDAIESAARACAVNPDAPGAQQLIDEARTRQENADREAEQCLYSARKELEDGNFDEAEVLFRKVLKTHPGHREVLEALDMVSRRRSEREIRSTSGTDTEAEIAPEPPPPPPARSQARPAPARPPMPPEVEAVTPRPQASAEPAAPIHAPEQEGMIKPVPAVPHAAKKASGPGPRLALLAVLAVGLALAAALGVKLAARFLGPPTEDPQATSNLQPVQKPTSKARPAHSVPAPPVGPSDGELRAPRTFSEAKRLVAEDKLDEAREILLDVVAHQPGDGQSASLLKSVQDRIVQRDEVDHLMDGIENAYKESRYDDTLRMLYRLPPELQKGEVERYKANAWYNSGIQYLLGGNLTDATRCFDEALAINAGDEGARRLKTFAANSAGQEKDRTYLKFVESLPKRPMNAH